MQNVEKQVGYIEKVMMYICAAKRNILLLLVFEA